MPATVSTATSRRPNVPQLNKTPTKKKREPSTLVIHALNTLFTLSRIFFTAIPAPKSAARAVSSKKRSTGTAPRASSKYPHRSSRAMGTDVTGAASAARYAHLPRKRSRWIELEPVDHHLSWSANIVNGAQWRSGLSSRRDRA